MAVLAVLYGCYEVDREIISSSEALRVPGLAGSFSGDDGQVTITQVPQSNDYRFRRTYGDGSSAESGYLRLIHLRDTFYAVQFKFDDEASYFINFYSYDGSRIRPVFIDLSYEDHVRLAQRHNVVFEVDELAGVLLLSGASPDILSFIRAHRELSIRAMEQDETRMLHELIR